MNRSVISKTAAGVGALALATVGFIAAAPSASAAEVTPYTVTFVARECTSYSDVIANRARNNLLESLQDLGPDTNYNVNGDTVRPGNAGGVGEDVSPQTNCTPLVGQKFTMGTGNDGGSPSFPSIVTNAYAGDIATAASTPLLNLDGSAAGTDIAGAVTVTLSQNQVTSQSSKLWIQGGTPAAPLDGTHGFATLRCGNDNLNGDNVEWVNFTGTQRNMFCYYYAITNPPDVGNIVIKKVVAGADAPGSTFVFDSNISFDSNDGNDLDPGQFALKDGQSFAQERGTNGPDGQGAPWTATETAPPTGFTLTDITCVIGGGDSSKWSGDTQTRQVQIDLAKGETVTCTFTNTYGTVPTCTENCSTTPPPCTSNCSTTPPPCTSNCGGSTPTPTPSKPTPTPTPSATVAEAAVAVGVPAQGAVPAAPAPAAAPAPEMGTVPESAPAGGGSTAPNGTPTWAWLLMALGAVGVVAATAKAVGARR